MRRCLLPVFRGKTQNCRQEVGQLVGVGNHALFSASNTATVDCVAIATAVSAAVSVADPAAASTGAYSAADSVADSAAVSAAGATADSTAIVQDK